MDVPNPWASMTIPNAKIQPETIIHQSKIHEERGPRTLHGRQMWGLKRFMRMLDGISKTIYGTKKIVKAIFFCVPTIPRSFGMLIVKVLEILTLVCSSSASLACFPSAISGSYRSRNAATYMMNRIGSTRRSIFLSRRFWSIEIELSGELPLLESSEFGSS